MYRARDQVANRDHLEAIESMAETLEFGPSATLHTKELFLTIRSESDMSVRTAIGACLYAAGLIAGDHRSQETVAEVVGVSRITVQNNWRTVLDTAGLDPPGW